MADGSGERKQFKHWYDEAAARSLARQMRGAWRRFEQERFVELASRGLERLEMQARVKQFADALAACLPEPVPRKLQIVTASLPPVLPGTDSVTDGWLQWPVGQLIADHGLPHFDDSMTAMLELTQRFSSEFAVRPFVEHEPERTFARLLELTSHPNAHVRRWCSEGTRPRLPWGKKLHALVADPSPIWPILEALKDDPSEYVRRSVANNLNDIAKDHPQAVVERCRRWHQTGSPARQKLVKHALRGLIKAGDREALAVLGVGAASVEATLELSPTRLAIGDRLTLRAKLRSTSQQSQSLVVDFVVHYVRQGDRTGAKVFKWSAVELPPRGQLQLEKRHAFRETTIRALYPGVHRVELQVNGERVAERSFRLAATR